MKHILIGLCCLWCIIIHGQISNELQKEFDQMLSGMQMEMDLFTQEIHNNFYQFVEKQDQEFQHMLEQNWQEFQLFNGIPKEGGKKPVTPPMAGPTDEQTSSSQFLGSPSGVPSKQDQPVRIPKTPHGTTNTTRTFPFYGTPVSIGFNSSVQIPFHGNLQEKEIAAHWSRLAESEYDILLNSLFTTYEKMGLNDWGFYMLIHSFSSNLYGNDSTSARLLSWFLLNKGGYRARLGINGNQVILLLPSIQNIYEVPFVEKDGIRYYAMQPAQGNLRTYTGEFSEGNRKLDLNLRRSPSFPESETGQRTVAFTYERNSYEFPLRYNKGLIGFYNDYPLTDMEVYFDASLSSEMKEDLFTHFFPILTGLKTQEEQVQLLLDFIYQSLPYMTDEEQFGKERYFFAEETIAYPYSDCEDRAVLLCQMTDALLNLPAIGVYYPNHVSAAVYMNEYKGEGHRYIYEGKEYISCDPTYINSLVGMRMSSYADMTGQVIPTRYSVDTKMHEETLWDVLLAAGKYPASTENHTIPAGNGMFYICGYDSRNGAPLPFVGKTDASGTFEWKHTIETSSDLYRPAIFYTGNRLFVTGQTDSQIRLENKKSGYPNERNLFLSALTEDGKVIWLQSYQPEQGEESSFFYTLNTDGTIKDQLWFPETEEMKTASLSWQGNELHFTGIVEQGENLSMNLAQVTHSVSSADVPDLLHTINNKLVADKTDKSIAGVFAFVELLNKPGQTVQGTDVIAALDKYNPTFKQRCPTIYKNIAAISLVVNESGVITVKTNNGKPVSFDKVRIQSGSKINLRQLPSKDIKIEIIDGVKVGAAIVWFKLNHVVLYKENGDLLFDYDKNHTTKTFNLQKDILN
ncbi:MAG: hypothetical protein LUH10_14995 [Tannerellaceae bacterium]|nr:hypothetical protein [Tannerellaceae bacterium]